MTPQFGFTCLSIDHIHFYVDDIHLWRDWYQRLWQFVWRGSRLTSDTESVWLSQGQIHLILSQSRYGLGEVAAYRSQHAQGIADIALQVNDLEKAYQHLQLDQAVEKISSSHLRLQIPQSKFQHSLIQRTYLNEPPLPGFELFDPQPQAKDQVQPMFTHIDHVVLNVCDGNLGSMAAWYEQVLGWSRLYHYTVNTKRSGLRSIVMGEGSVQLAINEPIGERSQIQEFIDANGGSGIQHVALHTPTIFSTVKSLRSADIQFLKVPTEYYDALPKLAAINQMKANLLEQQLLVDQVNPQDLDQLILQTFTQPLFAEPTFFYEIIQRQAGALGFGEGNFQALFEAIEQQQMIRNL